MDKPELLDRRILAVEDDYFIAEDLCHVLKEHGANVVGPVASVAEALATLSSGEKVDGAVLDVNLDGEMVFPVADVLISQHIPFVFTTGYDQASIPSRYRNYARCEKPVHMATIVSALGQIRPR